MVDREVEEVLRGQTLQRLVAVLGDRTDAVVGLQDRHMRVLWASRPGSRRIFRRDLGDFAGRPVQEFVHPDDFPRYVRAFEHALRGGTGRFQGRARTADGSWRLVDSYLWAAETAADRVVVISVARRT